MRLVIGMGQNDALVIEGFDTTAHQPLDLIRQAIQTFRFFDGTELTMPALLALAGPGQLGQQYLNVDSPESVWGSAGDDDIAQWFGQAPTRRVGAGDNNDRVYLGSNDHLVSGGWGDDSIGTQGGSDVVAGDAGNDVIRTGSQDDVVLFNRGDGHDWVDFGRGQDTLSFGPAIQPEDLSVALSSEGDWLILVNGGAGGSVQVRPAGRAAQRQRPVERSKPWHGFRFDGHCSGKHSARTVRRQRCRTHCRHGHAPGQLQRAEGRTGQPGLMPQATTTR